MIYQSQRGMISFMLVIGILSVATLFLLGGGIAKSFFARQEVQEPLQALQNKVQEQTTFLPESFSLQEALQSAAAPIRGEENGRVNVLVLGIGGEGHIGELLTDTIMLASFAPVSLKTEVFSIPRDLAVRIPKRSTFTKINSLYALGGAAFPNPGGIELTRQAVESIAGLPIHYYVVVDFQALVQVIDLLGGIFVPQDETLLDVRFPDKSFGYESFEVPSGWRYLNGSDALKYVRSRKSSNDFERMRRQHIVLLAVVQKIKGLRNAQDIPLIVKLYEAIQAHVATDGGIKEGQRIWELTEGFEKGETEFHVISSEPGNLLVSNMVEWAGQQAYILQPKTGAENYEEIQKFIQEKLTGR